MVPENGGRYEGCRGVPVTDRGSSGAVPQKVAFRQGPNECGGHCPSL